MTRVFCAAAAACAVVVTLAGCSSQTAPTPEESSTMTPDATSSITPARSRAEVDDLYSATTKLLGGTWKIGAQEWQECTTPSGTDGTTYAYLSQRVDQSLSTEPETATQEVRAMWAKRGVEASIAVDKTLTPPHYILSDPAFGAGTRADGFLIQLTVSETSVTFSATSRCVRGDADKLN